MSKNATKPSPADLARSALDDINGAYIPNITGLDEDISAYPLPRTCCLITEDGKTPTHPSAQLCQTVTYDYRNSVYCINKSSYVPLAVQVASLLSSGERLAKARFDKYYQPGEEFVEEYENALDPTRSKDFDVFSGIETIRGIRKRVELREAEERSQNAEKHRLDMERLKEYDQNAAKVATETKSPEVKDGT